MTGCITVVYDSTCPITVYSSLERVIVRALAKTHCCAPVVDGLKRNPGKEPITGTGRGKEKLDNDIVVAVVCGNFWYRYVVLTALQLIASSRCH